MKNKGAILRDFMEQVWNRKDTNRISDFLAPEYTIHLDAGDPWEGQTLSHAAFEQRLQHSFVPFPDIRFDIQTLVEDGDTVAITWIMTGTHTGKIGDLPPTHKKIETTGATFYYFRENLLCGHSQVFDRARVAKQLGF